MVLIKKYISILGNFLFDPLRYKSLLYSCITYKTLLIILKGGDRQKSEVFPAKGIFINNRY